MCDEHDFYKWTPRFLRLAREVSTWSKDPSTKVGSVIVRPDRTIAALGYNGFPRGVVDSPELYADRDEKLSRVVHAELNAIINASESLHGYTLYVWPFQPCSHCMAAIIQSGIKRVVTVRPTPETQTRWGQDFARARTMAKEADIRLTIHYATNVDALE